ncbi:MAG: hypothetical protein MUF87_03950 [Anaerolineae bacterium]|jgi:hypothetical protein|nr:hypothetical protein [Anaerolineae bacterium]
MKAVYLTRWLLGCVLLCLSIIGQAQSTAEPLYSMALPASDVSNGITVLTYYEDQTWGSAFLPNAIHDQRYLSLLDPVWSADGQNLYVSVENPVGEEFFNSAIYRFNVRDQSFVELYRPVSDDQVTDNSFYLDIERLGPDQRYAFLWNTYAFTTWLVDLQEGRLIREYPCQFSYLDWIENQARVIVVYQGIIDPPQCTVEARVIDVTTGDYLQQIDLNGKNLPFEYGDVVAQLASDRFLLQSELASEVAILDFNAGTFESFAQGLVEAVSPDRTYAVSVLNRSASYLLNLTTLESMQIEEIPFPVVSYHGFHWEGETLKYWIYSDIDGLVEQTTVSTAGDFQRTPFYQGDSPLFEVSFDTKRDLGLFVYPGTENEAPRHVVSDGVNTYQYVLPVNIDTEFKWVGEYVYIATHGFFPQETPMIVFWNPVTDETFTEFEGTMRYRTTSPDSQWWLFADLDNDGFPVGMIAYQTETGDMTTLLEGLAIRDYDTHWDLAQFYVWSPLIIAD